MKNGDKPANYVEESFAMQGSDGHGLTKREHFAAMAMQTFIGVDIHPDVSMNPEFQDLTIAEWNAMQSVKCADALLKELENAK